MCYIANHFIDHFYVYHNFVVDDIVLIWVQNEEVFRSVDLVAISFFQDVLQLFHLILFAFIFNSNFIRL